MPSYPDTRELKAGVQTALDLGVQAVSVSRPALTQLEHGEHGALPVRLKVAPAVQGPTGQTASLLAVQFDSGAAPPAHVEQREQG